jgi:hypothetical protein
MSIIRNYLSTSAIVLSTIFLASCATGPKVFVNQDPNSDLGQFKTFGFEKQLGTDRDNGTQSLLSQFFITAATKELELRGYKYSSENPDLGVNFYVSTKEKIRSTNSLNAGGYYGFRGGFYGPYGGYQTSSIQQYTEGTTTIDLINMSTDKLVWEGTAVGRITSDMQENLEASVNIVVLEVFAKYPTQQGGGIAYVPPQK